MNPLLNKELRKMITQLLEHKVGDMDIKKESDNGEFSKLTITVYPANKDGKYELRYQLVSKPKNTDLSDQQGDQ